MSKEMMVPQLRFEGFSGEWKTNKIDQAMGIRSETGAQQDFSVDIELENLVTNKGILIGDLSIRTQAQSVFRKGDILFGRLRPYLNKWWLAEYDGVKSGEIWALYTREKYNNAFIYTFIQTQDFLKFANQTSGTKMPRADWSILKEQIIRVPQLAEQTKIGELFQKLDRAIELQQQKVEKSERYKKAMLQKMFPQKGETEPQLRFEGFSGEWEETKLGEIVEISSGITGDSTLSSGNYRITRIETIAFEKVNLEKVGFIDEKPDPKFLLNKGDILYSNINSLSQIGKTAIFYSDEEVYHGINLLRFSVKPETSPLFLFFYLKTESSRKWAMSHANQAVNQASINQSTLAKQVLLKPTLEEQTKIGEFFQALDERIEAETKKLNHYESLKKAMLQRMFV